MGTEYTSTQELQLREVLVRLLPGWLWEYNARPSWLKNPLTNHELELDIYSPVNRIAFEYNGAQHFTVDESQGWTLETVNAQRFRDKTKYALCVKHDVKLLIVTWAMLRDEESLFITIRDFRRAMIKEAELAPLKIRHANGRTETVAPNPKITIVPTAGKWDMLYGKQYKASGRSKLPKATYNPTVKNDSLMRIHKHKR